MGAIVKHTSVLSEELLWFLGVLGTNSKYIVECSFLYSWKFFCLRWHEQLQFQFRVEDSKEFVVYTDSEAKQVKHFAT